MPIQDEDGPIQKGVGKITDIYEDESSNGNEYVAIEYTPNGSENKTKLWVWESSWQQDLLNRRQFYEGLTCNFYYIAKYPPNYIIFKYLIPQEKQDEWRIYTDALDNRNE